MYKIYDNFDSADKFVDLLLPLSTYTRKSAQQKKSRPQSRPLKVPKKSSLKKKKKSAQYRQLKNKYRNQTVNRPNLDDM